MQELFKGKNCTERKYKIANDLYNYYHLADTRRVGQYGYSKTDGCSRLHYESDPNYADEKQALEQALMTKLTEFFSKQPVEQTAFYKDKLFQIENSNRKPQNSPRLPFLPKKTRINIHGLVQSTHRSSGFLMFHIEDKKIKIRNIVDQNNIKWSIRRKTNTKRCSTC